MNEIIRPTPYSPTDSDEVQAIKIFDQSLDSKLVKSDIRKRDKTPNVDGYLEIVDENQVPVGKIEIQVRKIPEGEKKHSCDLGLFAYARTTTLPVILVCVDIINKKVFWKQITYEMAHGKEGQKTITINFSEREDIIHSNLLYLSKWISMVKDYQKRLQEYELIRTQLEEIGKNSNPLIGREGKDIGYFQLFVDELNKLLERDYSIVKRTFFPDIWKIGIALDYYDDKSICYSLFSIKKGYNDALIKQMDVSKFNIFRPGPHTIFSYWGKNELGLNPKGCAQKFVYERIEDIVENRLLSIRNRYLCREYLFDFIDRHTFCLGIESKDSYSLTELNFALNLYFPRWCIVAKDHVNYPAHLDHLDPGIIGLILHPAKYSEIDKRVRELIDRNAKVPPFPVGSLFFSFRTVYDLLSYCNSENIYSLDRIYRKRDPRLSEGRTSTYIWEGYRKVDSEYNVRCILDNIEDVFNEVMDNNGFDTRCYKLFNEFDKVLYVYDLKETYLPNEFPKLSTYFLKKESGKQISKKIECLSSDEFDTKVSYKDEKINFSGDDYRVEKSSISSGDFFFKQTPMLNLIYEYLEERLKEVFKDAISL